MQILLLPLGLIGAIFTAYKQIRVSQKLGLSQTAIEIINGRWTMDVFGIRKDRAARRLNRVLPNSSVVGLWMALLPLYVLYRLSGKNMLYPRVPTQGDETIASFIISRTLYFDTLLDKHTDEAEQFVILGAGLDTRAYGPLKDRGLTIFELDQSATQKMKVKQLKRARVPSNHVSYVEVDFSEGDWATSLADTGYDPSRKTIFLWEGVTLYLSKDEVCKTLEAIKSLAPAGSILLADVYADRFLKVARKGTAAKTLEATDEALGFSLDFSGDPQDTFSDFMGTQDYKVDDCYFMGSTSKKGPFMVVAELIL